MIRLVSSHPGQTLKIAKKFSKFLSSGDIVCFFGEIGSGKTTFIKGILKGLKVNPDEVTSSSFIIMKEYSARIPVFHIDLYRLRRKEIPWEQIYEKIYNRDSLVLIEWADRIERYLKDIDFFKVHLEFLSLKKRNISIKVKEGLNLKSFDLIKNEPAGHR